MRRDRLEIKAFVIAHLITLSIAMLGGWLGNVLGVWR